MYHAQKYQNFVTSKLALQSLFKEFNTQFCKEN